MNKLAGLAGKAIMGMAAGMAITGSAAAADLAAPVVEPTIFDVAFGIAGVTDYRFRGITNSKKNPAVQGYAELQALDWVYAGVWASSIDFPTSKGFTDPSLEIDFYGGLRHTWGAIGLDVGGIYYYYPGEKTFGVLRQTDYWELYAKPSYTFGDFGSITGNLFWTSDFGNTGANGLYLSVIPKINIPLNAIPDVGFYVSGELGHQSLKKNIFGVNPKDWWTWNIGGGLTYKAMTLDVRYSDTTLSRSDCAFNGNVSTWCGGTVVGKISFDTALSKLK